jgi:hypothetical protein
MRDTYRLVMALGFLLALSAISAVLAADVDQLLHLEQYRSAPAAAPLDPPAEPAADAPAALDPGVLYAYG